jgi:hypothetical protein
MPVCRLNYGRVKYVLSKVYIRRILWMPSLRGRAAAAAGPPPRAFV